MVNNTANYRDKCFDARRLVEVGPATPFPPFPSHLLILS